MVLEVFAGLILLLIVSAGPLLAGPAIPVPLDATSPDGTSFKVWIRGDEFQSWIESEDGYSIVKNPITRYWEYAEKAPDGSLTNSGIIYMPGAKAPAGIEKSIKPDRNSELEKAHNLMLQEIYNERLKLAMPGPVEYAEGKWPPVPVSGAKQMLIILINFAGTTTPRPLTTTAQGWYSKIFDTTTGAKSMVNFYAANSFGLMSISPAAHTQPGNPAGIITVTISDDHPNCGGNCTYQQETTILNHALAQATSYINFASFDANHNGSLEESELSVYFIWAGYERSGSLKTPNVWAHAWWGTPGLTAGTVYVPRWALNGELNDADHQHPVGVITHEMGHALCGLPDLYDTSYTNAGLGYFSLMSAGSWGADTGEDQGTTPVTLDAWARQYTGWATPVTPSANGTITFPLPLSSMSSSYKFVYPAVSDSQYFLAENRYPSAWDRGLVYYLGSGWQGGLAVYHVDTNIGTPANNDINTYVSGSHQGVMLEEASSSCSLVNSSCRGSATDLFYSGNNNAFTDSSTPNSKYYDGSSSGLNLASISAPGTAMSAVYSYSHTSPPVLIPIFSDGFEGSGWLTTSISGPAWSLVTTSSHPTGIATHGGTKMARFNSYDVSSGQARLYTSSSIAIPSSYDAAVLNFWMYHDTGYSSSYDNVQAQVSTNGSVWTNVGAVIPRYNGATGWANGSVDLSAYMGLTVQVGFLGTSYYGNDIYIDDMAVSVYYGNKARIGTSNYYQTLTDAYAAAPTGTSTIQARGLTFTESLVCNQAKDITLDGGYEGSYSIKTGYTILSGSLTISQGSLIADELVIQ